MATKFLTALPVFNEEQYVTGVLDQVLRYSQHVLVVDDGSTDGTARLLKDRRDIIVVTHPQNQGYGAALKSAFEYTLASDYEVLVTIDCDGQHEPQRIPDFVAAAAGADIVSGSRYLQKFSDESAPPADRQQINQQVTADLNRRLGLNLTDAFCGFKAYRREALVPLQVTDPGYAMPLQVWVQAAKANLKIVELPVPLIYLDLASSFGGSLDDASTRLEYYRRILDRALGSADIPPPHARGITVCPEVAG